MNREQELESVLCDAVDTIEYLRDVFCMGDDWIGVPVHDQAVETIEKCHRILGIES